MKIILSNQCQSLTGLLGKEYGYHLQERKNGICSKRNAKGHIPSDGHLRFILACAQLASSHLYLADIRLAADELYDALYEAHHFIAAGKVLENTRAFVKLTYNAADIINLKKSFGL